MNANLQISFCFLKFVDELALFWNEFIAELVRCVRFRSARIGVVRPVALELAIVVGGLSTPENWFVPQTSPLPEMVGLGSGAMPE